jgi:hypothetical protein
VYLQICSGLFFPSSPHGKIWQYLLFLPFVHSCIYKSVLVCFSPLLPMDKSDNICGTVICSFVYLQICSGLFFPSSPHGQIWQYLLFLPFDKVARVCCSHYVQNRLIFLFPSCTI